MISLRLSLTGLLARARPCPAIGRHLIFDGRDSRIEFPAAETKTGRPPYHAVLSEELTPSIARFLREHRRAVSLMTLADPEHMASGRLWLSRLRRPLCSQGVRRHIEVRTRAVFGQHVWPHLFRDCAVTELVDRAPEEIGIAPDLLGHADLRTTRQHDIQATGMTAHARILEVIAARRRAAAARRSSGA